MVSSVSSPHGVGTSPSYDGSHLDDAAAVPLAYTLLPQAITINGEGSIEGGYTVDGVVFFDTLAAMKSSLEEDRAKNELAIANGPTKKEEVLKIKETECDGFCWSLQPYTYVFP